MKPEIRKIVTYVEETHAEVSRSIAPPSRKAAALAVFRNPFAGRYVEALAVGGRPFARVGGLRAGEIEGRDGLR